MSKKNPELQPDLGYIDSEGKLRDDGLHDAMLSSKAGNAASEKAARDAAIKRGMSKATAEKLYGAIDEARADADMTEG
jgi:hypothetical protein